MVMEVFGTGGQRERGAGRWKVTAGEYFVLRALSSGQTFPRIFCVSTSLPMVKIIVICVCGCVIERRRRYFYHTNITRMKKRKKNINFCKKDTLPIEKFPIKPHINHPKALHRNFSLNFLEKSINFPGFYQERGIQRKIFSSQLTTQNLHCYELEWMIFLWWKKKFNWIFCNVTHGIVDFGQDDRRQQSKGIYFLQRHNTFTQI